jgi:hypothetical protein
MDKPKGSMHCLKIKPPGCGGFFIGMALFLSVVVDVVNILSLSFLKTKDDPPIRADEHALKGDLKGHCAVTNITQLHRVFGVYAALVVLFAQAFQTL